MDRLHWEFPANDSNETEGPNDAGITHFTSNRSANVIRESIQNSLDARADQSQPVRVRIQIEDLDPKLFAADDLIEAISASIVSKHNDKAHSDQFKRGKDLLQKSKAKVQTLTITDSNTTGATDELTLDGKPSKWEALTKSTGLSVKDQLDAGGSFGLGKHAPFAVTDIRTVLYSTAWPKAGKLHRRFQGKTILVSHEDSKGQKYRRTGYLGGENYRALMDEEIPDCYRLDEPGLAIHVPAYQLESDWEDHSIVTAIGHFFHAIIHEGLTVTVNNETVDNKTVDSYRRLLDERTKGFIRTSRTSPVATTNISDIGQISLRILTEERSHQNGRTLALVRDAGMMITDRPREMSLPGLNRFPPHWKNFVAIIECRSEGQPSVLRESESPSHNSISTQQISDPKRRRKADAALKELGYWCRERIREITEPLKSEDPINAEELARYLGIIDEEGVQNGGGDGRNPELNVTAPQQSTRAPMNTWARRGARAKAQTAGGTNGTTDPKDKGKGTKKRKSGSAPRDLSVAFANVRFQQGTKRPTHSVLATFDSVPETLRNLQLMASVEDGPDVAVGISEAFCGTKKLNVKHNKITTLPPSNSERCTIEFLTQVPVRNKSYYLTIGT